MPLASDTAVPPLSTAPSGALTSVIVTVTPASGTPALFQTRTLTGGTSTAPGNALVGCCR